MPVIGIEKSDHSCLTGVRQLVVTKKNVITERFRSLIGVSCSIVGFMLSKGISHRMISWSVYFLLKECSVLTIDWQ